MNSSKVLLGNAYDRLCSLLKEKGEKEKYRLLITSPPYYGHRHYGNDPLEIGQENSGEEYIDKLTKKFSVEIFSRTTAVYGL